MAQGAPVNLSAARSSQSRGYSAHADGDETLARHWPLAGVRVLSLAQQFPGPFAGMMLQDLGAEIVMVEQTDGGDPARAIAPLFEALNRGKRSVALDLKTPAGREAFLRLAETARVVL